MVITRFRPVASRYLEKIAKRLGILPAWCYTVLGLLLSLSYLYALSIGGIGLGVVLLALSGLLDAVDGAVARVRGEASPRGALLDSVIDRVEDSIYIYGFVLLEYPYYLAYLAVALTLLFSYIRARYESLVAQSLEGVGFMERSERIIILITILVIHMAIGIEYGVYALHLYVLLLLIGVMDRFLRAYRRLAVVSR